MNGLIVTDAKIGFWIMKIVTANNKKKKKQKKNKVSSPQAGGPSRKESGCKPSSLTGYKL